MSEDNEALKKLKKLLPPLPPPLEELDTDIPDDPFDALIELNNRIVEAQGKLDEIDGALAPNPLTGLPRGFTVKKSAPAPKPEKVPAKSAQVPSGIDIDSVVGLIDKGDFENAAKQMVAMARKTDCPTCAGYLNKAALELTAADLSKSLNERDWAENVTKAKNDLLKLKKALEEATKA